MFISIKLNNQIINIGQKLPDKITSCEIECFPGVSVKSEQVPAIKGWLNQLADNLDCEYVSYNGALMPISDVKKFK